jgi:diguanylate cyclase (GGDEF)-like protein
VAGVVYDLLLYNLIPLGVAVVCLGAARRVSGERVVWTTAAAAWSFSVVGNLLYSLLPTNASTFPTIGDACYMAAYPLIALLVLRLLHVRGAGVRPSAWLDGAVTALGVTACTVAFVLTPSLDMAGLTGSAVTLTYPVADVLLLALIAGVIAVLGLHEDLGLLLIGAAMVCKLAGDVLMTRAQAQGGYVLGGPVDLTWVCSALLTGIAAHLACRQPHPPRAARPEDSRTGWRVLVVPLASTVGSLFVLGEQWGDGSLSVAEVAALACLAGALARTAVTFREVLGLQEARRQAATDDLTGLPNRRALLARAERELASGGPTALLLLDLDGFKAVNDGLGHQAGDELLRALGERMRPGLRPVDTLARFGGDEFAVLMPGAGPLDALAVAERLHALVCRPLTLEGVLVHVGASIGVATAPDQARALPDLLRFADTAMYVAKAHRGGVRRYSPGSDHPGPAGSTLPITVPPPGGSPVLFRPLVDLGGRVVFIDAVVRGPDGALERADVAEVLQQTTGWPMGWSAPLRVTLSAVDVGTARLPDQMIASLLRHGRSVDSLVVQIDQTTLLSAPDEASTMLAAMRSRGLRTAVDGSGPGALALARLRDLPADFLRLDPALTADVVGDSRAALVVGHTAALARGLGCTVTADASDAHTNAVLERLDCLVLRAPLPASTADRVRSWLEGLEPVPSEASAGT